MYLNKLFIAGLILAAFVKKAMLRYNLMHHIQDPVSGYVDNRVDGYRNNTFQIGYTMLSLPVSWPGTIFQVSVQFDHYHHGKGEF